jgi:hypothetical protein
MLIQNGTIEFKTKTANGIDPETGYPVKPSSEAWGELIPCQFKAKKFNQLGIIKGEHFTVASYEILIEEQTVPSEQLRLKDLSGKEIGTFSIIQAEPLEAVCEVRILV